MAKVDQEGAFLMAQLMVIVVEDNQDHPDHILLAYCNYVYDTLLQSVQYLSAGGVQPPMAVLEFLLRFVRAAKAAENDH
ncbi:hypothetical protein [Devosia sp. A449]